MLALSKVPIILSHSGCKAVFDHLRNIDDARLRSLAASGGVIQISSLSEYLVPTPKNPDLDAALAALIQDASAIVNPDENQRRIPGVRYRAIQARYPQPRATFDNFMKHLLHAL